MSDVTVVDADGAPRAEGWIDFVHGAPDAPPFVFWLYLRRRDGDRWIALKDRPTLPSHVWSRLPERSKELCATERQYDARWTSDPRVVQWPLAARRAPDQREPGSRVPIPDRLAALSGSSKRVLNTTSSGGPSYLRRADAGQPG